MALIDLEILVYRVQVLVRHVLLVVPNVLVVLQGSFLVLHVRPASLLVKLALVLRLHAFHVKLDMVSYRDLPVSRHAGRIFLKMDQFVLLALPYARLAIRLQLALLVTPIRHFHICMMGTVIQAALRTLD